MKLYYAPGACSLAPHILLRETGADFRLEKVDLATHRTTDGADYRDINPKGYVPLLELADGQRLGEGAVISQYIAERANRADLLPAPDSPERYRVLEWQTFIGSELHKSFAPFFKPGHDENARHRARQQLETRFQWLAGELGAAYLTGDAFTIADAYLFTVANWSCLLYTSPSPRDA